MKKNLLLAVAAVSIGTAAFTFNNLSAQNDSIPGAPPAAPATPSSPIPQLPAAGPHTRPMISSMPYRRAIMALRQAKTSLERSQADFNGHRQTAMDACQKAIEELEAVQAAAMATAGATNAPQVEGSPLVPQAPH